MGGSLHEMSVRLERFPDALSAACACFPGHLARWKPAAEHWSVTEIVCHLADEETEDFRPRVEATLAGAPWSPLDLDGVSERRGYNSRELVAELERFRSTRAANVQWFRALLDRPKAQDWATAHQHPKFGPIRAGDVLTSWAAHDALHLRQIARRLHNLAEEDAGSLGCRVDYAGAW